MAKSRSPARASGAAAPAAASDRDRIIDAALRLIAEEGWRRLSVGAVAAEAGLPILGVYRLFTSRAAILCAFFRRIDEVVLAAPVEAEADERPRDRIFDLLMRRFDALQPYRGALAVLRRELATDPGAAITAGAALLRSVAWMLEAAGISASGIGGAIAVKLTTAAYLATLRVWQHDETTDLGATMAALDRRLRGIERWLGTPRRARPEAAATI